ncbi:MAG: TonB-dependent receptor [Bacteroidales bacterium]|nr:TonB-dependent receptor [Bacteroidales bacterium]
MKKIMLLAAVLLPLVCMGQNAPQTDFNNQKIDSTVVTATRASARTPVSYSEMSAERIESTSPLNSLPMTLSLMPSVVSTNEGGTGLGYSKFRVRGSDPTRTNVTINGIALNDAESQEVFWVNIASVGSMLNSAQLQRGLGTSTVGSGAFGASLNMQTALPGNEPAASVDISGGSYKTRLVNASVSTGRLPGGFTFDFKYNYGKTDGYIRNAWVDLNSMLASASWRGGNNLLKFNFIHGAQHSGITWEGISAEQMARDRRYNPAGEYIDSEGKVCYYDNDSDNYLQNHYQLIHVASLGDRFTLSTTLNYTDGEGYYEAYKDKKVDYINRKSSAADNFAGASNLRYRDDKTEAVFNMSYSRYYGYHFGEVIWRQGQIDYGPEKPWYENNSVKADFSTFARVEHKLLERFNVYADMQFRHVDYTMSGPDDDGTKLDNTYIWNFVNPKAGASFEFGKGSTAYASVAIGHKEPSRADLKDAVANSTKVYPEMMADYEFGYRFASSKFSASANIYLMEYDNQLVTTGRFTTTGYLIKENVKSSYRRGVELVAAYQPVQWFKLDANATFSTNKIKIDGGLKDLALSPTAIACGVATFRIAKRIELATTVKFVGKQYIDNTGSEAKTLPHYTVMSQSASFSFTKNVKLSIFVDNLLNKMYVADAWAYGDEVGYYPQAPRNGMVKLSLAF